MSFNWNLIFINQLILITNMMLLYPPNKVSQNNLMIEGFVGNEMTLKAALLMCDPIVKFDI